MDFTPAFDTQQSLYGALHDAAEHYPQQNALLYMGQTVRYGLLLKRVDALAAALAARGIRAGDAVTVCLPNIPDAVYAFYALSKLGARAHLVHPLTTPEQMRGCLTRVQTKLFIVLHTAAESYLPLAAELGVNVISCNPSDPLPLPTRLFYNAKNKTAPESGAHSKMRRVLRDGMRLCKAGQSFAYPDPKQDGGANTAVLLHSGGTSGAPKTIALSAAAINALSAKGAFALGTADVRGKYMLSVLPMFHGFGMCMGIHAMLSHGGCNAIMPKFSARAAVKLLGKNKLHFAIGVPILYEALLARPEFSGKKLQNLRVAFVGGDFVSHAFLQKTNDFFAKNGSSARLLEGYGLTETVTVCAVNTLACNREGSVGQALPGIRIEAAGENGELLPRGESGELLVSGDTLMTEYVGDAEATANTFWTDKQGTVWVKTGDFGFVDADGFVFFRQRIKRIVKVSGISVYPFEIEQLVAELDGVKNVCALAVPDRRHGEMLALYVAAPDLGEAERAALADSIRERIRARVSVYALPRTIRFLDRLPATNVGKINAEQLRSLFPDDFAAQTQDA